MKTLMTKNVSVRTYQIGFVLSVLFTLAAFALATHHVPAFMSALSMSWIIGIVTALAFVQFATQLMFFLHLGNKEEGSQEKLVIFAATAFIVTILVSGSLWIMNTLSPRMMPDAAKMTQYMQSQVGM